MLFDTSPAVVAESESLGQIMRTLLRYEHHSDPTRNFCPPTVVWKSARQGAVGRISRRRKKFKEEEQGNTVGSIQKPRDRSKMDMNVIELMFRRT